MAIYLLFSATYNEVPLASIIDMKVKESLEKSGSAKNAAFWNWTPLQKSILDAELPRVIMTSYWSTGKTRILFVKALMLARDEKFVIFVLHYSKIIEENKNSGVTAQSKGFQKYLPDLSIFKKGSNEVPEKAVKEDDEPRGEENFSKTKEELFQTNFADHAPILLYHSLMNEIDKESEKNPQVKANIKLMMSKDLKEDILETNAFDIGELVERL